MSRAIRRLSVGLFPCLSCVGGETLATILVRRQMRSCWCGIMIAAAPWTEDYSVLCLLYTHTHTHTHTHKHRTVQGLSLVHSVCAQRQVICLAWEGIIKKKAYWSPIIGFLVGVVLFCFVACVFVCVCFVLLFSFFLWGRGGGGGGGGWSYLHCLFGHGCSY